MPIFSPMQTNTDINAEGKKSATIIVKAILCDLDGTLIDSARCIDYAWQVWSTDRGLIPQEVIDGTHGLRTIEAIRMLLPDADQETIEREADLVEQLEVSCTQGLIPISGSHRMLGTLSPHHWAIVIRQPQTRQPSTQSCQTAHPKDLCHRR